MKWPEIIPAIIDWRDNTLVSKDFDDIYFLPGKGLAEKRYVFLEGVGLKRLIKKQDRVTIGEVGFGAGLNFLLTWQAARKRGKRLNYFGVEGFPLKKKDLRKALSLFPEVGELAEELVHVWPPLVPGFHRLGFDGGKVNLTLVFGDILASIKQITGQFDAWYLDGFAPEKNPEMWEEEVFRNIARLSAKAARIATYSAAGNVRRGLERAGFKMSKRKGFDKKRESLTGVFEGENLWKGLALGTKIAVIGGGIAGCSAAHALTRKGFKVTVFEREKTLAAETSGHPLAVIKPKLQKSPTPYSVFLLASYLYSLSLYEDLGQKNPGIWNAERGILEAATNPADIQYLHSLAALFPGLLEHLDPTETGLNFPKGGCVVPKTLCRALTRGLAVRLGQEFKSSEGFDAVVYANGHKAFETFAKSPFRITRGQLSALPLEDILPGQTLAFPGGYLTPKAKDGFRYLGTSFKVWKDPRDYRWRELSRGERDTNLKALDKAFGPLPGKWRNLPLQGRAALRCETIDHLPVAGPAFDEDKFKPVFREKQKLPHSQREMEGEADAPGEFVLSGFASRGFTAAPYAAEILGDLIAGTPPPCTESVLKALSPSRFLLKQLKKG